MNTNESWQNYWNKQTDARHSRNKPEFHEKLAREMLFHFGDINNASILELGCGDGAMIPYLNLNSRHYTGIDFSRSLLHRFSTNHPDYKTIQSGVIEYMQTCKFKYDLIFSFGVLQYLNSTELSTLFTLQSKCLSKDGVVHHFGIPVKEHRNLFTSGLGIQAPSGFNKRNLLQRTKSRLCNKIGNWHSLKELHELSTSAGFFPKLTGGINYYYRMNLTQSQVHAKRVE